MRFSKTVSFFTHSKKRLLMPSFEVLELSLFSCVPLFRRRTLDGFLWERSFLFFPFLCCFRFLCYGVPSLLLLFLFCSIGLANTKFSLVCVILLVRSISLLLHISDCLSFFCFLFNNKCYNKQIIISSYNIIVVCDKLDQQEICIVHLLITTIDREDDTSVFSSLIIWLLLTFLPPRERKPVFLSC